MTQLIMKRSRFISLIGALAGFHASAWAAVTSVRELPGGAQFTVDGGSLRIQFWSPDTVRITYATGAGLPALKSLAVVASPEQVRPARGQDAQAYTLSTPRLKVLRSSMRTRAPVPESPSRCSDCDCPHRLR